MSHCVAIWFHSPLRVDENSGFFHGKFGVTRQEAYGVVKVWTTFVEKSSSFFSFIYHFDFASFASVLVLFSQCVDFSHHFAQSFSSEKNETLDALVNCHCVEFFFH